MRVGTLPGGEDVCHGYHVWDEGECLRCGLLDAATAITRTRTDVTGVEAIT